MARPGDVAMAKSPGDDLLAAAGEVLPPPEASLLGALHAFAAARLRSARRLEEEVGEALSGAEPADRGGLLHAFLRECWEALDGIGRETNVCMARLFPRAGLFPPLEMTRQCTLYVVRLRLHRDPATAVHPVAAFLWRETRAAPPAAYLRLSFLHNLALFVAVPILEGGLLPGAEDVPEGLRGSVRPPDPGLGRCEARAGLREIADWLESFAAECYRLLAEALRAA